MAASDDKRTHLRASAKAIRGCQQAEAMRCEARSLQRALSGLRDKLRSGIREAAQGKLSEKNKPQPQHGCIGALSYFSITSERRTGCRRPPFGATVFPDSGGASPAMTIFIVLVK